MSVEPGPLHCESSHRVFRPSYPGNPAGAPQVVILELAGLPVRTAVDASPAMLPRPAHDTQIVHATPSEKGRHERHQQAHGLHARLKPKDRARGEDLARAAGEPGPRQGAWQNDATAALTFLPLN